MGIVCLLDHETWHMHHEMHFRNDALLRVKLGELGVVI